MTQNIMHLQLGAAIKRRIAQLDAEIAQLHAEDYAVDADRALDARSELVAERDALKTRLLA
jgi:uncharacterized small protein (DUF1192 family)